MFVEDFDKGADVSDTFAFSKNSCGCSEFSRELIREILYLFHSYFEKDWFENVFHGLDRDNERGRKIFDDYDSAHPVDKGFLEWERARFEDSVNRLNNVLKNID